MRAQFSHTIAESMRLKHRPVIDLFLSPDASVSLTINNTHDTPEQARAWAQLLCDHLNTPPPDPLPTTLNSITQSIETLFAEQCERDWAHSPTTRRLLDQLLSDVTIEIQRHNPEETAQ